MIVQHLYNDRRYLCVWLWWIQLIRKQRQKLETLSLVIWWWAVPCQIQSNHSMENPTLPPPNCLATKTMLNSRALKLHSFKLPLISLILWKVNVLSFVLLAIAPSYSCSPMKIWITDNSMTRCHQPDRWN